MGTLGVLVAVLALMGLVSASAFAAGAPTAETNAATGVGESGATLVGKVKPNGALTGYWFEYGTTTSYGSKTVEKKTIAEITANTGVSGLALNTTYHYRLVAKNSFGTSFGADETFKTVVVPPEAALTKGGSITELEMVGEGKFVRYGVGGFGEATCSIDQVRLRFTSPKQFIAEMTGWECSHGSQKCSNGKEGELKSEPLKGRLGYTNAAKKEVGLILEGESSNVWASSFKCYLYNASITGALAGNLTVTLNKNILETSKIPLKYSTSESGAQQAGELSGQLYWPESTTLFGVSGSFEVIASREYEIQG
jgi:hypothetical protein